MIILAKISKKALKPNCYEIQIDKVIIQCNDHHFSDIYQLYSAMGDIKTI